MKLKNILLGLLVAVIAFSGCDKISNPIISSSNGTVPISKPSYINISDTTGASSYKNYKMLLEIIGGHLCTNCPFAQTDAEAILNSPIGGQVVFIQDETGPESSTSAANIPPGAPAGSFQVDYQCVADSTWYLNIFGSPLAFPMGIVNREAPKTNVNYSNYQDSCSKIITRNTSPAVTIKIQDSCWTTNPRFVAANFTLHFLKPRPDSLALETLIVEDSIADWQDSANHYKPYYMHRNTVRGAFGNNKGGSVYGVPIFRSTTDTTIYQTYDFTGGEYGKAAGWNMEHCRIVAFVYNQRTYEVVQAEMIKVE